MKLTQNGLFVVAEFSPTNISSYHYSRVSYTLLVDSVSINIFEGTEYVENLYNGLLTGVTDENDVSYTEIGLNAFFEGFNNSLKQRVVVRKAEDFGIIDSSNQYFIDGVVDMTGSGIEINAFNEELFIAGYGYDLSFLICNDDNYTLFTASNNVAINGVSILVNGLNSEVYDLQGFTGFESFEVLNSNYIECSSLGEINGYRQGLESNIAKFGGTPRLLLSGTWLGGFKSTTMIVRSTVANSSLYEAGTGLVFNSRFFFDGNVDLPVGTTSLLDFSDANFASSDLLQIQNAIITRAGVIDSQDTNLLPNISPGSISSDFKNNTGLANTYRRGTVTITAEADTDATVADTFYRLAGGYTLTDLVHLVPNPLGDGVQKAAETSRLYRITGNLVLDSRQNSTVSVRFAIDRGGVIEYTPIVRRVVNNLQGSRDVAYFTPEYLITLNTGDFIYIEVANNQTGRTIIAELDSYYKIAEV